MRIRLDPVLSGMSPVHILTPYFSKIHFARQIKKAIGSKYKHI
jgi:hypothetical protein